MTDLLPCPFCGVVPTLDRREGLVGISCGPDSDCNKTGLCIAFSLAKEESAVKAWNRRATSTRTQGADAPPFANCRYRQCDLPGQCRDEGSCHHPESGERDAAHGRLQKANNDLVHEIGRLQESIEEDDPARLWAEIYYLREQLKGPDNFATWKDAAIHERQLRVADDAQPVAIPAIFYNGDTKRDPALRAACDEQVRASLATSDAAPTRYGYVYEWDYSPGVVHRSFDSAPYNGRQPDRTIEVFAAPRDKS